jgi:hypothetical protein
VRKQFRIRVANRCAALENLNDSEDINRARENINEYTKTSAKESLGGYELKQHKTCFDEDVHGFRSKESGQNAVITTSKPKHC